MVNQLRELMKEMTAEPPAEATDLTTILSEGRRRVRRQHLARACEEPAQLTAQHRQRPIQPPAHRRRVHTQLPRNVGQAYVFHIMKQHKLTVRRFQLSEKKPRSSPKREGVRIKTSGRAVASICIK